MTIRNLQRFNDALWDWAILDGCFGNTRIAPTDVDGMVERNGQFLFLEAKGPSAVIPVGQRITFEHALNTGIFTVIVVWGRPNEPEAMMVCRLGRMGQKVPATLTDLRQAVADWYRSADKTAIHAQPAIPAR